MPPPGAKRLHVFVVRRTGRFFRRNQIQAGTGGDQASVQCSAALGQGLYHIRRYLSSYFMKKYEDVAETYAKLT